MKRLYFYFLFFLSLPAISQNLAGLSTNNYSAIHGLHLNPASGLAGKAVVQVQLASINANFYNNYLQYPERIKLTQLITDTNYLKSIQFDNTKENLTGKDKFVTLTMDGRGPGFYLKLKNKFSIGYEHNRIRLATQVSGMNEMLARNIFYSLDSFESTLANKNFQDNTQLTINAWSERMLHLGYTPIDDAKHSLSFGINAKSLFGLFSIYLQNNSTMNFYHDNNQYSNRDSLILSNYDISYGYTSEFAYNRLSINPATTTSVVNFDVDTFLQNASNRNGIKLGSGRGLDMGAMYVIKDGDDYKFKFGASLMDLGKINYNLAGYTKQNIIKGKTTKGLDIENWDANNSRQFDSITNSKITVTSRNNFVMRTPASLNLQADYRVMKGIYVNGMMIQNLRSKEAISVRNFSSLAITPRLETKFITLAVPLMFNNGYRQFNMGACINVLNSFFIGSDNLSSVIGNKGTQGFDIYAGAAITIGKFSKKPKAPKKIEEKKEEEKVIAKEDEVKNETKPAEEEEPLMALPLDMDVDGIVDSLDNCPEVAGSVTAMGCPDADNDGIADKDDRCPKQKGNVDLAGCPDKDNDGLADVDDKCPDQSGKKEFAGCPDTDGDGVSDNDDKCPLIYGLIKLTGCPESDTDGDGIADSEDKCPNEIGVKENSGCPIVVAKEEPKKEEPKKEEPKKEEPKKEEPKKEEPKKEEPKKEELKKEEPKKEEPKKEEPKEDLNKGEVVGETIPVIYFEANFSELSANAMLILDQVAELMKQNPNYKLQIDGHTDNDGYYQPNMDLSRLRAEIIKKYLVKKGISAKRIKTQGFGLNNPAQPNDTPEGRKANRRGELRFVK